MSQLTAVPPAEAIQAAIKAAIDAEGEARVVERTGLSRHAVAKLAAGLPTRRGTRAQAALELGLIASLGPDLVGEIVGE